TDADIIDHVADLFDCQDILSGQEPAWWNGQGDHHVIFIGWQPTQLLAVEKHSPGLPYILLPEHQRLFILIGLGLKTEDQLRPPCLFGEIVPFRLWPQSEMVPSRREDACRGWSIRSRK